MSGFDSSVFNAPLEAEERAKNEKSTLHVWGTKISDIKCKFSGMCSSAVEAVKCAFSGK
jgi:hypothetical protein